MTIFGTLHLIVTLDSIRNSCDIWKFYRRLLERSIAAPQCQRDLQHPRLVHSFPTISLLRGCCHTDIRFQLPSLIVFVAEYTPISLNTFAIFSSLRYLTQQLVAQKNKSPHLRVRKNFGFLSRTFFVQYISVQYISVKYVSVNSDSVK